MQLPPVAKKGDVQFCFESPMWTCAVDTTVILKKYVTCLLDSPCQVGLFWFTQVIIDCFRTWQSLSTGRRFSILRCAGKYEAKKFLKRPVMFYYNRWRQEKEGSLHTRCASLTVVCPHRWHLMMESCPQSCIPIGVMLRVRFVWFHHFSLLYFVMVLPSPACCPFTSACCTRTMRV